MSARIVYIGIYLMVTTLIHKTSTEQLQKLKEEIATLARQVMLQQLSIEDKVRTDGGSGIKQVRIKKGGPETYYTNSHTGDSIAAIHDHSNYRNTAGQGEGRFVLNGVEFSTRHNDYLLRMPSRKLSTYHLVEDIPFPPVPRDVLIKPTVQEQIDEMREWFKAWKLQNTSLRDYRRYFRPVLCYLEGAWITKTNKIEEPFSSERHSLDANTWLELEDKVRFNAYTGRKDVFENIAYLPTTIFRITEDGVPEYAQWNYRILCHPLSKNLPTPYLRVVDDLSARLPRGNTLRQHVVTRAARFQLVGPHDNKFTWRTLLDELMSQIPGKDNYVANITDTCSSASMIDPQSKNRSRLQVGFYHRQYQFSKADAMGLYSSVRGFSDANIFMAETTQSRVSSLSSQECKDSNNVEIPKRMSYAIPLEIIYLTPLSNWNPYNLTHFSLQGTDVVTNGGKRTGGNTKEKAYNGTNDHAFYKTPEEFFSGTEIDASAADTAKGSIYVLNPDSNLRNVRASGIRILLPNIPNVGIIRTRYPIMPVHGESSGVWKELNALKDIVKRFTKSQKYLQRKLSKALAATRRLSKLKQTYFQNMKLTLSSIITDAPETGKKSISRTLVEKQSSLSTTSDIPLGEHSDKIEVTRDLKIQQVTAELRSKDHVTNNYFDNRYKTTSCNADDVACLNEHTRCELLDREDTCQK